MDTDIPLTDKILDLTLEIIYLLTGEDYTVVKKTFCHHMSCCSHGSQESDQNENLPTESITRPSLLENDNDKKILDVTNEIIELLTEEVPIRCQDVALYFSTEEWQYLEDHWNIYKNIMAENRTSPTSPDRSSNRNNCLHPLYPQNSSKEHVKTPQAYPGEGLIVVKVEVKEEAEDPFGNADDPYKADEVSQEISTGAEHINRNFKNCPLASHLGVQERNEDQNTVNKRLVMPGQVNVRTQHSSRSGEEDFDLDLEDTKQENHGESRFSCEDCGKRFQYKAHLTVHQRFHTGERPSRHPGSSSPITSQKTSQNEKKRFECSECGKGFQSKSHCEVHERRHRGEKPFECLKCGKAFVGKCDLLSHQRSHIGQKPFTCSECGKCFVSKQTLSRHMFIHTGEKPFECPECGKRFRLKQTLSSHLRIHTRPQPSGGTDCQNLSVSPYWEGTLEEPQIWPKYV